ncbi:MAG: hypothetical protein Q7S94_07635 [Gallionella sp.]|nr:hypothetical protein [Gallionella sp.]
MKRKTFMVLVVNGIISLAFAVSAAYAEGTISGAWEGRYTCQQGNSGLTLHTEQTDRKHVRALFHFYPLIENPNVPEGCFEMDGIYNKKSQRVEFIGRSWIVQPSGYGTVNLSGQIDEENEMSGRVKTGGCSEFELKKTDTPEPLPKACARYWKITKQ